LQPNKKFRFAKRALVLDENGEKLGEMPITDAKRLAEDRGLDLVEVGRQPNLSICRIMDEGKWKYEQKKRAREARQKQHTPTIKELKFSMRIDQHDEQTKIGHAKRFLGKGDSVRIIVEMRGREKGKRSLAEDKMNHILSMIGESAKVEHFKKTEGSVSALVRSK
jgi:translation initiation factor IF-3